MFLRPLTVVVLLASGLIRASAAEVSPAIHATAVEARQALIAALPDAMAENTLSERLMQAPVSETTLLLIELGLSGRISARPLLLAQLQRPDPLIVERALRALAMLGVRGAKQREQVELALAHQLPAVRIQALACLETIDDLRICSLFIDRLADPEPAVRKAALTALQNVSGREDLGVEEKSWAAWHREKQEESDERFWEMGERLRSPNSSVVIATIQLLALSAGDSARAVELIEPLLHDEDALVVFTARQALAQLAHDIYQQPTSQELVQVLALGPAITRTINVAPQQERLSQWWGLLFIAVVTASVWATIMLFSVPKVRRANRQLVRWVRGPGSFLKPGRKLSDVVVPRAKSTASDRAGPHRFVLRVPWPASTSPSVALHGAMPRDATATEGDPFVVFDRFAAVVAPVSAPAENEPALSLFARSERTVRILNALREGRLHLRGNPEKTADNVVDTAAQTDAPAQTGASGAIPDPALSFNMPGDPANGGRNALPISGSSVEPITSLNLVEHLAHFDGFSEHLVLPIATAPPSSLFVYTARTARVLTSLRTGRRHLGGADDGSPASQDESAPTPEQAVPLAADSLDSPPEELASEPLPSSVPLDPISPFASVPSALVPSPAVESPSSVFVKSEHTTRRLRKLRASRRKRTKGAVVVSEDDTSSGSSSDTSEAEPVTETMRAEEIRGLVSVGATESGTAEQDDPFTVFDRFTAAPASIAPPQHQPVSSVFSKSGRTVRKLRDLRQRPDPVAQVEPPVTDRALMATRTPLPADPSAHRASDGPTIASGGLWVVLGEELVGQVGSLGLSLPVEPSSSKSAQVSERWNAVRSGNRADEEHRGF